MIISFDGYHGTSLKSAQFILKDGYISSIGYEEWLGDGIYFFIEGINKKTLDLAEKWSIAQSWDNENNIYKYKKLCILKSIIEVDESNFLDLTTSDGMEVFEYLVNKLLNKLKGIKKKVNFLDGAVINLAREQEIIPIDVVKGNFFIKFTKERKCHINLRTQNCTICAVYDGDRNIKSTKIIKTGDIK